ncbi:MAG: hypothetical protein K5776_00040 [Lachnospiraceae bacterium]|nr:hypothetical protein [Lachnospiraceae bacterium]
MYLDIRDKKERLELAEYLEKDGFSLDKERVVNSVLPIIVNFMDKTADRFDDMKSGLEETKRSGSKGLKEFYDCYQNRGLKLDGGRYGYTLEELNYYYGDWIENPLENVDLSQDRGEPNFDEDTFGEKGGIWAHSDFVKHAKKMELSDFPNKDEYANYLENLRSLVMMAQHGLLGSIVHFSNDNWDK